MERDDAAGFHVLRVQGERFGRDQVHGDGIARKRVDREDIEIGRRLALERQARVAERRLDVRFAFGEVGEVALAIAITAGLMS